MFFSKYICFCRLFPPSHTHPIINLKHPIKTIIKQPNTKQKRLLIIKIQYINCRYCKQKPNRSPAQRAQFGEGGAVE